MRRSKLTSWPIDTKRSIVLFLFFGLPFVFWPFALFVKQTRLKFLWIGLLGVVLIATRSNSAILAVFVMLSFYLATKFVQHRFYFALIPPALFFIASIVVTYVYGVQTITTNAQAWQESRAQVWQTAFAAGLQKPVFGWGFGNTEYALEDTAQKLQNALRFQYVDSAHNIFLDWWVQGGTVGLLLFLGLLGLAIVSFVKMKQVLTLTLLIGLLVALSFNPASVVASLALWWLIGHRGL